MCLRNRNPIHGSLSLNRRSKYSQTYIYDVLRVQEKGIQVGICKFGQSFRPTQNISWGFFLCPTPPTCWTVTQFRYAELFLRALCTVRMPVTTLDCILLKEWLVSILQGIHHNRFSLPLYTHEDSSGFGFCCSVAVKKFDMYIVQNNILKQCKWHVTNSIGTHSLTW